MRYILAVLSVLCWITPAQAVLTVTLNCATPDLMAIALLKYNEQVIGAGMDTVNKPTILQVNPKTGSWTLLWRFNDKSTCLLGGGSGWVVIDARPVKKESAL